MYEETRVYTTTTGARWVPAGPAYDGGNVEFNPWLDTSYLRTLPGLLKVIVIVFNLLCFMCLLIGGPAYYAGVGGATFVSVFGFIISLTLLMLYLFHIVDQFAQIPWIVCEMIFCFAWTIFYFIAGSVSHRLGQPSLRRRVGNRRVLRVFGNACLRVGLLPKGRLANHAVTYPQAISASKKPMPFL
uniref:MARVEL domain-containing protein n=1 Tax=Globodera pallida TaxID=36090 RepID=A0A183BZH0_GLOPA